MSFPEIAGGTFELVVDNILPSWMKTLQHHPYGSGEYVQEGRQYGDIFSTAKPTYNACGTCWFSENTQPKFGKREAKISVTADIINRAYITDSLGGKPEIFYETFDGTLSVKGVALGTIHQRSDTCRGSIISEEALGMGDWAFPDRTQPQFIDLVPDRLWRTLVANLGPDRHPPPTYYRRACLWALQRISRNKDLEVRNVIKENLNHPYLPFLRRVDETILGRRFFRAGVTGGSSVSRLFGLCPAATIEDDLVCILYGCHVPVVLRKRNKCPVFGLTDPKIKGLRVDAAKRLRNSLPTSANGVKQHQPEAVRELKSFSMPGSFPENDCPDDVGVDSNGPNSQETQPPQQDPGPRILQQEEKLGEFYEVVGECYVYGYMDGEITKEESWEPGKLETFVLI